MRFAIADIVEGVFELLAGDDRSILTNISCGNHLPKDS